MKKSDSTFTDPLDETALGVLQKKRHPSTTLATNIPDISELQQQQQHKLRKSFSEDLPKSEETEDILSTSPLLSSSLEKTKKSRLRLSSAFRSFRSSSSKLSASKKKLTTTNPECKNSTTTTNTTNSSATIVEKRRKSELEKIRLSPKDIKKKSKLAKKFSLSGIRKQKLLPSGKVDLEQILVSSGTQTTSSLLRQTPEGGNLSASQTSFLNFTTTTTPAAASDSGAEDDPISPVKFEKVRKLQITISGKKIEQTRYQHHLQQGILSSATTSSITGEGDYLTVISTSEPPPPPPTDGGETINSGDGDNNDDDVEKSNHRNDNNSKENETTSDDANRHQQQGNIHVTESSRDTPPRERAPTRPTLETSRSSNQNQSPGIDSINQTEQRKSPVDRIVVLAAPITKGAIRKTSPVKLRRQKSREESLDPKSEIRLMQQDSSKLERGRRFPRPIVVDHHHSFLPESQQKQQQQQQQQQQQVIKTRKCVGIEEPRNRNPLSGNNLNNPNLSGAIADRFTQIDESSTTQVTSVTETKIEFSVGKEVRPQHSSILTSHSNDSNEFSSLGSNRSSGSQSPISEGSLAKRRIRYIEQPTFYTDEEREILEGKREALRHLSGISEYSFDSEFSVDNQMPAFGDLTMDNEEAPIMTSPSTEKREHLYKILVIGELGTGKTSFIKRYVHQFFSQNYRATIGVDFALKVLHWDQNTIVRLQLWDIAGQERFGNMTRVYYKEAVGAFIVFDVTRSGTFDCVSKWKEDLDSKVQLPDGNPIPCILLANKCDQDKQGIVTNPEKMDEYVREKGFAGWFETSAKENINIEEAAKALVNKILLNDKLISASDLIDNEKIALGGSTGGGLSSQGKKSCSC